MKFLYLLFALFPFLSLSAAGDQTLKSPSGVLNLEVKTEKGSPEFKLVRHQQSVATLDFGVVLEGAALKLESEAKLKIKHRGRKGDFSEYLLSKKDSEIKIRLRLFDDAFTFRYESENEKPLLLKEERSSWTLAPETKVWYFERRNGYKLKSYAGTWLGCPLSQLQKEAYGKVQGTPIVFQLTSGAYGFLGEAALADYSGMRLEVDGNRLTSNFTEGSKGFTVPVSFKSPWRVLYVGEDLNAMVNQHVMQQLCPKPDAKLYADCSYIQPGKSVWRWFCKGTGKPEQEREMIDLAAQMHFTYTTVDDGWKNWPDQWGTIKELAAYGKSKGVKVIVWKNSGKLRNTAGDYEFMRQWLDKVAEAGVAGIKVDFMDSEAKPMIDFELRLLKECAKRSLVVNFHGCQASSGEYFTYPNEVTREGIRGVELNKMAEGYVTASHNAALPFTRFLVGHGDYTPLTFTVPGATTFAHQLATLVCFDSPMQTIAEDPVLLLNDPHLTPALDYLRSVPTVWEETRVLPQSEIGKLAVMARRSGNDWYIAALNGEDKEKTLELNLKDYCTEGAEVVGYVDNLQAEKVLISMKNQRPGAKKREPSVPFKKETELHQLSQIRLAPNGGAVIMIRQK